MTERWADQTLVERTSGKPTWCEAELRGLPV